MRSVQIFFVKNQWKMKCDFGNLDEFSEFDLKSNINGISLTTGTAATIPTANLLQIQVPLYPVLSCTATGKCSPVLSSLFLKLLQLALLPYFFSASARCIFLDAFAKALPTSIYNFSTEECTFGRCFQKNRKCESWMRRGTTFWLRQVVLPSVWACARKVA